MVLLNMSYLGVPPATISINNFKSFMRSNWLKGLTASICSLFTGIVLMAQDCGRTGLNNTVVTSLCSQTCRDLNFQVPDLRSSTNYVLISTPYDPFPYVTPGGTTDNRLYDDDTYSNVFSLPFPFCFYGTVYTQAVVSSNGLVTFDPAYANCPASTAAWNIVTPLPTTVTSGDCAIDHYPRASIMGCFMDLDPRPSISDPTQSSPADRKIEWRVEGTAPCRRFVVSFYHIGVYQATTCGRTNPATFQIVMYESSGLIDIFIENKVCNAQGTNGARAILGIHDATRTQWLAAAGKNATPGWTAFQEGYRFVPNGGSSRFVSSELLAMDLTPLAVGTATNTTPGLLDINFANICTPVASRQYIIRTTYAACDNAANLLISMDTITVNRLPADFAPTITPLSTACAAASNGSIQVVPTTGTNPYTFILNPGAITQNGATANFTGLAAGAYTITIADAVGCESNPIPVTVAAGTGLTTTLNKTDALCNGAATGMITVTQPVTGSPPYAYSLDGTNWQPSNVFNGLTAGTYTVYYRDGNGCQGSQTIEIAEPPILSANASTVAVVCNGQNNGTITITTAGGVAPYEYSIWQPGNIFNVAAGTYTVTIRDFNGCLVTQTIAVTEPAALTASSVNGPASCNGGNDGTITVTANGGNAGYQYSIDGTNFQSTNIFNVAPGNYTVTVRDNLGCTTSFPTSVVLNNDLVLTPQTDPTICEGTSTQLSLVSNATQYSWTPSTGLSSTNIPNPVASPAITTQYTVTATLGRCSANDIVTVNVNAAPIPDAGADGFICYGQTYQLQGAGGTQYLWTPGTYLDNNTVNNPVSTPTKDITYSLSIVSDINGCASLVSDDVTIDVTPPIKVSTFPYDSVGYSGDQFTLLAVPSDPDVVNYTWTPVTGLSDPTIPNPVVTVGAVGDVVQYRVLVSTIAGCSGEGYVTVRVYKGPDIYVPTGFTPNADGKNDRFTPFPVGIKSYKYFRVFNRWGQLVFSTNQLHNGWDGKMGGREQPGGVYIWMIEGLTKDDRPIIKKGSVMLIR
jgi:gliding motility-associated-like protein